MVMFFFGFATGAILSKWVETMLLRIIIRSRNSTVVERARTYAKENDIKLGEKGKVISMRAIDAHRAYTKGGNLGEILDYGVKVQEE